MKLIFTVFALICIYQPAMAAKPAAVTDQDYFKNNKYPPAQVELGRMLFFDKILSGNKNTSCATCHHTLTDTSDGISLPVGEGGNGLGIMRNTGIGANKIHERVPRNSPAIFNLGAKEFTVMFHDGRIQADSNHAAGFQSPAGKDLPTGIDTALAVQALFPITSTSEMAGQAGENQQANAASANNFPQVWKVVLRKLKNIPEYVNLFAAAYDDVNTAEDMTIVHYANAVGAFEASTWRFSNSPYDKFLRGNDRAITSKAKLGLYLFNNKAGCVTCHSGKFQTDQSFHAIAMPQIGPGKGDNLTGYNDGQDDFGREQVTGNKKDRFRFRTPSLRNIALTSPYGHAGTYNNLKDTIKHHLNPAKSLRNYDQTQAVLPSRENLDAIDFTVMNDPYRVNKIAAANELTPIELSDNEIARLIEFLNALTDPAALDIRYKTPTKVPSGLSLVE